MDKLYLFILFVVPGFISLKTYELLFPGETKDSSKQLVDAVAYSCLNYGLLFFPILLVENALDSSKCIYLYYIFYFFVLFLSPILLVFIWRKLRQTQFVQKNAPHPTLKPWDFVFAQRKSYWIKVTMKDGTIIGGLYSHKSFASSAPAPEQIYLEEVWVLNENGGFERKKNDTAGVIVLSSEISHIELRD